MQHGLASNHSINETLDNETEGGGEGGSRAEGGSPGAPRKKATGLADKPTGGAGKGQGFRPLE